MKCYFPFSVVDGFEAGRPVVAGLVPAGLLTFAELVAPSGFFAAGFFAFDGSRVAAEEAGRFQGRAEFGIDFEEGAGDAEFGGFSLSFDPAAGGVDLHVVFIGEFDGLQRQFDLVLEIYERKILFVVFIVDDNLTVAFAEEDPGDGFLTATNCVLLLFH